MARYTKQYYQDFITEFNPQLIIGEGVDGNSVVISLLKIVHLLFGGQSGSGKSVFVLQLLFQMLFLTNPETLKLILIDPLRVSFKDFKKLPHLVTPIASTPQEAINAINKMIRTSKERYQFLENVGFENIYDYNEALLKDKIPFKDGNMSKIVSLDEITEEYIKQTATETYSLGEPIPQLVTFIDEFNALMLDKDFGGTTPADANTPVLKDLIGVSEQARKAGIIIILGTQKIDASTVPTKIRGNLKTRICLKVSSTDASRAILGDTPENKREGARLSGYGDGLVFNEDLSVSTATRFQSAYVGHQDMLDLVNGFITAYGANEFDYISVNDEYAKNSNDLEPLPIPYEQYKIGLPDVVIVKDNVFLQPKYQKLLSQLIREPFMWDDKTIKLRYPSVSKDLAVIKQQFTDVGLLAVNMFDTETGEEVQEEEETDKKKKKKEKEEEGYFGLNLKLRGVESVLIKAGITKEQRDTWDTKFNEEYLYGMMRLCLLHLNKYYNTPTLQIQDYL